MDKLTIFRSAAELTYKEWGAWAFDTWESHNETYFDNELEPEALMFGLTPYGRAIGLCKGSTANIHPQILLHQNLWDSGKRFASDVLLHEMVHQLIRQRTGHSGCGHNNKPGDRCTSHNNDMWVVEINRMSTLLGIDSHANVIKQKRMEGYKNPQWFVPEGVMTRKQLSTWPHSVTSREFYKGETDKR